MTCARAMGDLTIHGRDTTDHWKIGSYSTIPLPNANCRVVAVSVIPIKMV